MAHDLPCVGFFLLVEPFRCDAETFWRVDPICLGKGSRLHDALPCRSAHSICHNADPLAKPGDEVLRPGGGSAHQLDLPHDHVDHYSAHHPKRVVILLRN